MTHAHDLITPAAALEALRGHLASLASLAAGHGSLPDGPLMGDLMLALRLAIKRLVLPPGEASQSVVMHPSCYTGAGGPLPEDGLIAPGKTVLLIGRRNYAFKPGYLVAHAVAADGTLTPCRWPVLHGTVGDTPLRGGAGLYDGGDYPIAMLGQELSLTMVNPGPAAAGLRAELVGVIPAGCLSKPPACGYLINDAEATKLRAALTDLEERVAGLERGRGGPDL
jgi:hypothetical protein